MTGTWPTWRSSPPRYQGTRPEARLTDASWAQSPIAREKYSSSKVLDTSDNSVTNHPNISDAGLVRRS